MHVYIHEGVDGQEDRSIFFSRGTMRCFKRNIIFEQTEEYSVAQI